MELGQLRKSFNQRTFGNEDDIKIHFYSDIVKPLLESLNPDMINQYKSENNLLAGGKTDATFQNISFEYKKENHFSTQRGIDEALYGRRNKKDRGLYHYLLNNADIHEGDDEELIINKILSGVGVGFDGVRFLFARFVLATQKEEIDITKTDVDFNPSLPIRFFYEEESFDSGLKKLALLLKQQEKISLNKKNLISFINPQKTFVKDTIRAIYDELQFNITNVDGSNRVRTLYKEWDRIFGIMYGEDDEATAFTEVSSFIKELYGYDSTIQLESKIYLFALQTFFNIFLKLLIHSFLAQIVNPTFTTKTTFTKAEIDRLFDGELNNDDSLVNNFFESHFMEWFTYTDSGFEIEIINKTLELIDVFDLNTFVLKPEEIQDILQEVYMELIPAEMRHLMGEYFSPDWIVEHSLDMLGYNGDINKNLIDPTAGSGTFLTHAIKRVIYSCDGKLSRDHIDKITDNIIGFDINPISVVSAKANYILAVFSACADEAFENFGDPVDIPVYIADSILSPVVYTEESDKTLSIATSVGKFEIPKFSNYRNASEFLKQLSVFIHEKPNFERFWNRVNVGLSLISDEYKEVVEKLFDTLYVLHRAGKDSFWPIILRNSFAPILIGNKFDYVIGNPPWIAWKSMSKSYRKGTLEIWKSYGIFEKSAYDKKTTHDDFGMAVTYVAVDKYLKEHGKMVFLLPASFLKSTKGGEGFRKFFITRNEQNVPFSVEMVDDFSAVSLFTVPTVAVRFTKGSKMKYPMKEYTVWTQFGRKSKIKTHEKWAAVLAKLSKKKLIAQPVDMLDMQSAWLTMDNMEFANSILDSSKERFYLGRKGIEPAGAKGVYILKKPIKDRSGLLKIENDISRSRRKDILLKGIHKGKVEETFVFPMLGGRNIERWRVKSNEFILVPHSHEHKYGIPETELEKIAPHTIQWLDYFHDELLASRIQNGKFFNPDRQPYYRLDNIGEYTYSPYKVLWKEQTGSMSAVVVGTYLESIPDADESLFMEDKVIVVDSKVLMLALCNESEAHYVCGILNAPDVINVIDSYAISTNRGTDVLKYLAMPKYDSNNKNHSTISNISRQVHAGMKNRKLTKEELLTLENELNESVKTLFTRKAKRKKTL